MKGKWSFQIIVIILFYLYQGCSTVVKIEGEGKEIWINQLA